MYRKTLFAAALLGIFAPVAANAESMEVRYGDLNLASSEGRERLDTRIRIAARKVCVVGRAFELKSRMAATNCVRVALASAQPQLLTAYAAAEQRVAGAGSGISVERSAISDS